MDGFQFFNGFELKNDLIFNQKVDSISTIYMNTTIRNGQGFLAFHLQSTLD